MDSFKKREGITTKSWNFITHRLQLPKFLRYCYLQVHHTVKL